MKNFQHLLFTAIILFLCLPVQSGSQSRTQTTIVNGKLQTVTIDSLTVYREDSVLKNTFTLDFYGDTISHYERYLHRIKQQELVDYIRTKERKDKDDKERIRAMEQIMIWLAFGLILMFCSYLVLAEQKGYFPNIFGRFLLSMKNKLIVILQKLKSVWLLLFLRKQCPFCKTRINAKASGCRHCLRNLPD
jgi:hypothetical protein